METKYVILGIIVVAVIVSVAYFLFVYEETAVVTPVIDIEKEAVQAVADAIAETAAENADAADAAAEEASNVAQETQDPIDEQVAQVIENQADQAALDADKAAAEAELAAAEAARDAQAAAEAQAAVQEIIAEKQAALEEQARIAAEEAARLEAAAQEEAARIAREEAARIEAERVRAAQEAEAAAQLAAKLAAEEAAAQELERARLEAEELARIAAEEAERQRLENLAAQEAAAQSASQPSPAVRTSPVVLHDVRKIGIVTAVSGLADNLDITIRLVAQQANEDVISLVGVIQMDCFGADRKLLSKLRRKFNGECTATMHPNTTSITYTVYLVPAVDCAVLMLEYDTHTTLGITQYSVDDEYDRQLAIGQAAHQDTIVLYDGWRVEPFVLPPIMPRYTSDVVRGVTKIVQIIRPLTASSGRIRFGGPSIEIKDAAGQIVNLSGVYANENVVYDVFGQQVRKWWSGSIVNSNSWGDLTPTFESIVIDFKIPATDISSYKMAVWDMPAYSVTVVMHGTDGVTAVTVMNPSGTFQVWPAT